MVFVKAAVLAFLGGMLIGLVPKHLGWLFPLLVLIVFVAML